MQESRSNITDLGGRDEAEAPASFRFEDLSFEDLYDRNEDL